MPFVTRTQLLVVHFISFIQKKIDQDRIKKSTLQAAPFWLGAALAAFFSVAYTRVFAILEIFSIDFYKVHSLVAIVAIPAGFLLSAWVVKRFSPEAGGSGIPQLMVAIHLSDATRSQDVSHLVGLRTAVVKVISSIFCASVGGAIGREGPTLQIAGSIFYVITKRLPKNFQVGVSLQSMLIAGGAAGLAAAFNTPLGGIVYVIEELAKAHLSFFRTTILQVVIVAGLIAQLLLGPYLYLGYPSLQPMIYSQLPLVIFAGVIIGFIGALFGHTLYRIQLLRERLTTGSSYMLFTLVCAFLFVGLTYLTGGSNLGSGREMVMQLLFTKNHGHWLLSLGRIMGNLLTYISGCAGGIFSPALSSGAALGSVLSLFFPQMDFNMLVILGMVSFLTGVTRTPFTSFVLVLEMTDRHSAIFPMMIAALTAHVVSQFVDSHSVYENLAERNLERRRAQLQSPT